MKQSLAFDLELYSIDAIEIAYSKYLEICSVYLDRREKDVLCTFCSDTIPVHIIGLEFGNYLIELMQQGV